MHDVLKTYCESHLVLEPTDFTYGTSLKGSPRLFGALSRLYASPHFGSVWPLEPHDLVLGPGVSALYVSSPSPAGLS
jgi:hypothetical protein